jgi:hypothetical protein
MKIIKFYPSKISLASPNGYNEKGGYRGIREFYVGAHLCVRPLRADTQVCPYCIPVFTGVTAFYGNIKFMQAER